MTTIIAMNMADDRAIYTDALVQHGSIAIRGVKKCFVVPGILVGGWCGLQNEARRVQTALQDLFHAGKIVQFFTYHVDIHPVTMTDMGHREFEMLILYDEAIWLLWEDMTPIIVPETQYFAKGSGGHFALGALAAGASPWKALAIASQYDVGTGGPFFRCDMEGNMTLLPSLLVE